LIASGPRADKLIGHSAPNSRKRDFSSNRVAAPKNKEPYYACYGVYQATNVCEMKKKKKLLNWKQMLHHPTKPRLAFRISSPPLLRDHKRALGSPHLRQHGTTPAHETHDRTATTTRTRRERFA